MSVAANPSFVPRFLKEWTPFISLLQPDGNPESILPNEVENCYTNGFFATFIGILAYSFSRIDSLKIVGGTVVIGSIYGIANDILAVRDSIAYFSLDHCFHLTRRGRLQKQWYAFDPYQHPFLNAFFWGMHTTWKSFFVGGICLALLARCPIGSSEKLIAHRVLYPLALGSIVVLAVAQAKVSFHKIKQEGLTEKTKISETQRIVDQKEEGQRWELCFIRNKTGYDLLPVLGVLVAIGTCFQRAILQKASFGP